MTESNPAQRKPLILVVDDSEYNRELLQEILSDDFSIIQAENGIRALEIIEKQRKEISCVLLDISMEGMDGFEVLEKLNNRRWIKTLPVIIISAENSTEFLRKGYTLGASDYIFRPFDSLVVKKRVQNTVKLYANQKKLAKMVIDKINENNRMSDMMISILGHTVEFRNKESNLHISNVSNLTKIFLEELNASDSEYYFNKDEMMLITRAAALHDLGKVSIPDEVLNKPGKFTDEEFAMMKKHTIIGAQMLEAEPAYKNEPLVKKAYNICRWHHERFDGRGYPDKLSGNDIPIEAQIVSIADVYDALTSERCYKKAFSHEQAIEMINNNECGVFNPVLIECLNNIASTLPTRMKEEYDSRMLTEVVTGN